MAGDEVGSGDEIFTADGVVTEAQMADGDTAGLLGVIAEVRLNIFVSIVTDDGNGVLVGTDGTVRTQTPEHAAGGTGRFGNDGFFDRQREIGNIVFDTDGEVVEAFSVEVLVDGIDHGRSEFLAGKTVAAADDGEIGAVGESGFDVEVKRFTETAGFFGTVEDGDLFATGRESGLDMFDREGTIQTDFDKTDFFAFGDEVIESFFDGFAAGTHGDDDFISIGGTDIVEEVHRTAGESGDLIHVFLDDTGQIEVDLVGGFAALEVDVRVLGGHFGVGSFRTESALTETFDIFHIDE